jgi:hypothetical protein
MASGSFTVVKRSNEFSTKTEIEKQVDKNERVISVDTLGTQPALNEEIIDEAQVNGKTVFESCARGTTNQSSSHT